MQFGRGKRQERQYESVQCWVGWCVREWDGVGEDLWGSVRDACRGPGQRQHAMQVRDAECKGGGRRGRGRVGL
jgi:hypothetical protein